MFLIKTASFVYEVFLNIAIGDLIDVDLEPSDSFQSEIKDSNEIEYNTSTTISDLNEYCLLQVFSWLDSKQQVGVERVSKLWQRVVQRIVPKSHYFVEFSTNDETKNNLFIINLENLFKNNVDWTNNLDKFDNISKIRIFPDSTEYKRDYRFCLKPFQLELLSQKMPNWESFSIEHIRLAADEDLSWSRLSKIGTQLKSLEASGLLGDWEEFLFQLLSGAKNLINLNADWPYQETTKLAYLMESSLCSLESVEITKCDFGDFIRFLANKPQLKNLKIRFLSASDAMEDQIDFVSSVSEVDLYRPDLTYQMLTCLRTVMPNLIKLKLEQYFVVCSCIEPYIAQYNSSPCPHCVTIFTELLLQFDHLKIFDIEAFKSTNIKKLNKNKFHNCI